MLIYYPYSKKAIKPTLFLNLSWNSYKKNFRNTRKSFLLSIPKIIACCITKESYIFSITIPWKLICFIYITSSLLLIIHTIPESSNYYPEITISPVIMIILHNGFVITIITTTLLQIIKIKKKFFVCSQFYKEFDKISW